MPQSSKNLNDYIEGEPDKKTKKEQPELGLKQGQQCCDSQGGKERTAVSDATKSQWDED